VWFSDGWRGGTWLANHAHSLFNSPPLSSVVVEETKRDFFFHLYLNILARTVNHTENVVEQLSDPDGPWMVRVAHMMVAFVQPQATSHKPGFCGVNPCRDANPWVLHVLVVFYG